MQRKRVLIIDDEEAIREVAALAFELAEWDVACASSGAEGLAAAMTDPPDAIVLDVMMPDLDGPATYRLLVADKRTRDIPVIFLTAKIQNADRRRYVDLGVRGVIAKPFDPLKLPDQVEALLSREVQS